MKNKILIILMVTFILVISGCTESNINKNENKTPVDYSKGSTTARVNIIARKENATLNISNNLNQTNKTY